MSKLQYNRMMVVEGMLDYLVNMGRINTPTFALYLKRWQYYRKLWIKAKRAQ